MLITIFFYMTLIHTSWALKLLRTKKISEEGLLVRRPLKWWFIGVKTMQNCIYSDQTITNKKDC